NDPLIRCTHSVLQRSASELVGNVHSDDGKSAVIQRQNIWGATYRSRVATESRRCAETGDRLHGDLQRRGRWYRVNCSPRSGLGTVETTIGRVYHSAGLIAPRAPATQLHRHRRTARLLRLGSEAGLTKSAR